MAHAMKMPFFHGVTDREDDNAPMPAADADSEGTKGDGLHHHQLDEDEGGGYHSIHTHPDGRVEEADHDSYQEARDHMDAMHGEGGDDSGDSDDGDDIDMPEGDDIAGKYGRAADCE